MSRDEWCSSRHELCSVVLTWIELCTVALCCVELSCFVLSCVSLCFSKLCRMLSVAVVVLQWSSFMPVAHDSAFRVCVWHISENCKNCVWASVPKHLNDCKRLKAHREVYFKIDLNKFVSLMTRFPWFPSKATDVARFNGWRSGFACFFSLLLILETWIEGRGYCLLQRRLMPRHSHSSSSDPRPRRGDRLSQAKVWPPGHRLSWPEQPFADQVHLQLHDLPGTWLLTSTSGAKRHSSPLLQNSHHGGSAP